MLPGDSGPRLVTNPVRFDDDELHRPTGKPGVCRRERSSDPAPYHAELSEANHLPRTWDANLLQQAVVATPGK